MYELCFSFSLFYSPPSRLNVKNECCNAASSPMCASWCVHEQFYIFFLFYPHFKVFLQRVKAVFLLFRLYTRLFSLLKFKESWFSAYWNVLFLKSKIVMACHMPGSAVLQFFVTQNCVTVLLISEI
jgi:hypothetical protein